jgi:hypothetical protein
MGIPARGLPHTVTRVRPATSPDGYGDTTYDYGAGATRTEIDAWIQQDQRSEKYADGRTTNEQNWLLMSNDADLDVVTTDQIEWADHPSGAMTFTVEGPPEPLYTPAGFHHWETTLRVLAG